MPAASDPGRLCDPPIGFGNGPIRPGAAHRSHQIEGTTPARLEEAVTLNGLLSISENRLFVEASVQNVAAGHAFPTGISLRNVILRVLAQADNGELTLLEGPLIPELGSDRNGVPEEGDWAGQPGFLFGKVLAGRINGVGEEVSPVLFVDAERVAYQQVIQPFETHVSQYQFDLSGGACQTGQIDVTLQLVYRRAWRFLAVEKGWTTDALGEPWEQVIASWQDSVMVPPSVQIVADPDPACPDGTTLTAVPACLQGPFTYSWSGPNIIGPSDSPSIVVQPTASSTYSLTVSGMNGMAQSQFSLGVLPAFSWPQLLSEWALVPSQPAWDLNANGHLDILDLMPFQTCPP